MAPDICVDSSFDPSRVPQGTVHLVAHSSAQGLEPLRDFLTGLFVLRIDARRWFEKLELRQLSTEHMARKVDSEMTIEAFCAGINERALGGIRVVNAQDVRVPRLPGRIELMISVQFDSSPEVRRFAWFECDLTAHNFKAVAELYQRYYGERLDTALARSAS